MPRREPVNPFAGLTLPLVGREFTALGAAVRIDAEVDQELPVTLGVDLGGQHPLGLLGLGQLAAGTQHLDHV
jgi:hypothetical protein